MRYQSKSRDENDRNGGYSGDSTSQNAQEGRMERANNSNNNNNNNNTWRALCCFESEDTSDNTNTNTNLKSNKSGETKTRYLVAFLLCIANAICYADRTNIGIACTVPSFIPDKGDRGVVLSAFFYGYILTQIPAGYLVSRNRIGVKQVLGIGVVVWTVCDTSTIFVVHSVPLLFVVRALMGCGEGVVMPCLHKFATNWFPVSERSTMVALISSGSDLGTITALCLSPWILSVSNGQSQWRYIFLVFGGFSVVWLFFYTKHVASKPEEHPRISKDEKELIVSTRRARLVSSGSASTKTDCPQQIPWRTLLQTKQLWVIYIAHFSYNYAWYVLLGWLPTYLHDHLGLNLKENRGLAAMPYVCGYFGLLLAGRLSDLLIARGFRTLYVRRAMNSIASFIPGLCLYLLPFAKQPYPAIFLLSFSCFAGRASTSGFWIYMIDVCPEHAGEIMGISNTIATLPGIVGNVVTGYILQQETTHGDNWTAVFHIASLVSAIGGMVFACFSTDENVLGTGFNHAHGKRNDETNDDEEILLLPPFQSRSTMS